MINVNSLIEIGGTYKNFGSREVIFSEGTQLSYYHQLVSGRVAWGNSNEEGKEFIQKIIEPGECFGELPLFDDGPYAADAVAIVPSVVIRLPKATFLDFIKRNPEIHFQFSRLLAQRVRYDFNLLKSFAFENPENRIHTLLSMYKNMDSKTRGPKQIHLTRQQIANMTGLRVETVIRTIRQMNQKGLLMIDQGKVYF